MSNAVIDASIVAQLVIDDTYSIQVEYLLEQVFQKEITRYAPEFCVIECANVIWKHARLNDLPAEKIEAGLNRLPALPIRYVAARSHIREAYRIGFKHSLAIYDSIYIALARSLDCPLITVDARQAAAAQAEQITLKLITDFAPADNP
jgi:predicted nucleic acid-binding protein